MKAPEERFDPYYTWLGIPPEEQPPHYYRLLGLRPFEDNPTVIENAVDQRMAYIRTFQTGLHSRHSQRILNELAAAKICLLNPAKKAAYDQQLRQAFGERLHRPASAPAAVSSPGPPPLPGQADAVPSALPLLAQTSALPPAGSAYPPKTSLVWPTDSSPTPTPRAGGDTVGDRFSPPIPETEFPQFLPSSERTARYTPRATPVAQMVILFLLGGVLFLLAIALVLMVTTHPPTGAESSQTTTTKDSTSKSTNGFSSSKSDSAKQKQPGLPSSASSQETPPPRPSTPTPSRMGLVKINLPKELGDEVNIWLDDRPVPITPGKSLVFPVPSGDRTIKISRPKYKPYQEMVHVGAGEQITISPQWEPKAILVLELATEERSDTQIFLDDQPIRLQDWLNPFQPDDPPRIPVEPGQYTLRIERTGYEPWSISLRISEGEKTSVQPAWRRLHPPASTPPTTLEAPSSSSEPMPTFQSPLDGRGKGKGQLLLAGGGAKESELAVARALKWLAEHQLPDGGWSFNHTLAPSCKSQCRNPGNGVEARNAATGLALLPFLGARQTHKEGKYKETVRRALAFLLSRMDRKTPQGGSFYESSPGKMYSHGICTIALCEAAAMTEDPLLQKAAQEAVRFIVYAQDPVGGGWRYEPRQRGDTSVFSWQFMALHTAQIAHLQIPPITFKKAEQFLDSVQSNNGTHYGYTDPGAGPGTTAIGLLCRMMLGWKKENAVLERGVQWLSNQGPNINPSGGTANMYYNYYATQVLRHWEGELWDKWNVKMRDSLVQTQAKEGHAEGSWFFTGDSGGELGGRLYYTAMATLILEVYYRHLPIYQQPPSK